MSHLYCLQVFRNEGVSSRHNPEFTSVEIYQAYADYSDMMCLTEELLRTAAQAVCGKQAISYQGVDIDLSQPFRRVTMNQLVQDATGKQVVRLASCYRAVVVCVLAAFVHGCVIL
jgi:lysyl-tRNA synthetase class 2